MLMLVSPAKIQNFKQEIVPQKLTEPLFLKEASSLVETVKRLSLSELSELLEVKTSLAALNMERLFNWQLPLTPENAKPAVIAFDGEVFRSIGARTMDDKQLEFLQTHLRILSGLYGMLRPLDLIQAYRLDVGNKLKTRAGEDLYTFWRKKITKNLNATFDELEGERYLLNLASGEYIKTVDVKKLKAKVIDFEFLEYQDDRLKPVVIYIKKARGMMVRYVVENQIHHPEGLKGFSGGGYWYDERLSTPEKMVFIR
jgi:uncharacterized protein